MKVILPKTIKFRITTIIMITTIVTTSIISYFCFYRFHKLLRNNLINSTGSNLQLVMKNIENNMYNIEDLTRWCTTNSSISSFVVKAPNYITGRESLSTYYNLQNQLLNSKSSNHINKILVSNYRNALLQISDNTYEGSCVDGKTSRQAPFFDELIEDDDFKWIGLKDNPFRNKKSEMIIPIVRPIYSTVDSPIDGWVYISVNTSVITDYLKDYHLENGSKLYITINDKTYLYEDDKLNEVSFDDTIIENVTKINDTDISYCTLKNKDKTKNTVVSYSSSLNGWRISESIPDSNLSIQKSAYFPIMLMIVLMLLSLACILTFVFNKIVTRPIKRINNKILKIANGDFSKDESIESSDELGSIGKGINILSQNVVNLIESRLQDEKQKKELEFRMLQSQINPHFLYNTLNSIKWMATIQNATGIPEMTSCLARLLRNIAKGTSEIITIKEEIDLLKDYITIQQYKYGGTLTVNYNTSNDYIYECNIIKFTLQPIVENAIFHGIEPKGTEGIIDINFKDIDNQNLIIEVIDNGVGMTEDTIQNMFKSKDCINKRSFNQIGISNVNERIKLTFGNEYGLSVESKIDEYTKVTISLPYKTNNINRYK